MPIIDPLLHELFATFSELEIHNAPCTSHIEELISKVIEANSDIVFASSNHYSSHKDPLSYFYEKFLEQSNPQLRDKHGVYYTPSPVVSYIIRSIDFLLRTRFHCQNGLAETSEDITLLDPACGTGIFLQAVMHHIRSEFQKTGDPQKWQAFVHSHLLPRMFGFELLKTPYAIAHFKLAMQLAALDIPEPEHQEWAYHFEPNEHLNIYLTNTLEPLDKTLTGQGDVEHGGTEQSRSTGRGLEGRGQAPPLLYSDLCSS